MWAGTRGMFHVSFALREKVVSQCTSFYLTRLFQQHNEIWFISKSFRILCGASGRRPTEWEDGKRKKYIKHLFFKIFLELWQQLMRWSLWDERADVQSNSRKANFREHDRGNLRGLRTDTHSDRQAGRPTDRQTSLQKESGYVLWHMLCWANLHVCSVWGQHCSHIWSNYSPRINVSFQNPKSIEIGSQRSRINLLQMCVIMEAFLHMNSLPKT